MRILLCSLCFLLFNLAASHAAEARVITENGTNILAVGIDNRDFEFIRFYLKGTNVLELKPDDLVQKDRSVLPPVVRGGSILVNSGETTKAIVFNQPMKDATYIVLATPTGATTVSIPAASKTTNGFTINLTAGINGRVDWLAINP